MKPAPAAGAATGKVPAVTVDGDPARTVGAQADTQVGSGPRRRFPRRLWLIVALQGLLMLAATVLYPAFQNADEVAHVDYVLAHRDGQWLDAPGSLSYQAGSLAAKNLLPNTQVSEHVGGSPPLQRSQRLSFDALGAARPLSAFPNQMTQHPPLYYGVAAGFSYLLPNFSHHRFDIQVFWLRLLSVLLLLPVPLLIFSTARRITGSQSVALIASLLPLAIPSYLRTGSAVSNDSLLLLLMSAALALLARAAFGDLSRRTAVLIGLAWGGALLTKGFALSLPPVIVLAYLVASPGSLRRRIALGWRPMIIAGAVGSAIGVWWWVRNVLVYHAVQPDGLGNLPDNLRQLTLGTSHGPGTELGFLRAFSKLLGKRTFGSLGLIDMPTVAVPLLQTLVIVLVLLMIASMLIGVGGLRARIPMLRDSSWSAGRAVALMLPALLIILMMYGSARSVYLRGQQLPGVQVRYLLPASLGVLICVAVALCSLTGRFARWVAPVLLTLTLGFIALSTFEVLEYEMSGRGRGRLALLKQGIRFVVGWSPLPSIGTSVLFLLTGLVAVLALIGFWFGAVADGRSNERAVSPAPSAG